MKYRAKNIKKYAALLFLLFLPEVAHVSGNEHASLISEKYALSLTGGLSADDYDRVRKNSEKLSEALKKIKPQLDEVFDENVLKLGLPVVRYDENNLPDYIDGVLVEKNETNANRDHFFSYFDNKNPKIALAVGGGRIPDTSFEVSFNVLVTERIKAEDLQSLILRMIECIKKSEALTKLIY